MRENLQAGHDHRFGLLGHGSHGSAPKGREPIRHSWVRCSILLLLLGSVCSCNKDEAPPPLPSAQPVAEKNIAQLDLEIEEVDAGEEEEKPKVGRGRPAANLQKCCAALQQNAKSAPEPTATYMKQAAAMCASAVAAGQSNAAALGAIRGVLRGAQLPGGCR